MGLKSTFNTIFYGNNDVSIIGVSGVDLYVDEKHRADNEITDFAIEDGGNVSDHAVKKPEMVTLTGVVSNLSSFADRLFIKDQAKAQNGYQQLIDALESKTLLKVITQARVYDDMLIQSLNSKTVDVLTGGEATFEIILKRITFVKTQDDEITPDQISGDDNPAKNQCSVINNGLKKPTPTQQTLSELTKLGFIS